MLLPPSWSLLMEPPSLTWTISVHSPSTVARVSASIRVAGPRSLRNSRSRYSRSRRTWGLQLLYLEHQGLPGADCCTGRSRCRKRGSNMWWEPGGRRRWPLLSTLATMMERTTFPFIQLIIGNRLAQIFAFDNIYPQTPLPRTIGLRRGVTRTQNLCVKSSAHCSRKTWPLDVK